MVLTSLTRCSIRLLRRPNSLLVNSRLCSSDTKPKSNMDFPNFTTKGKHSKDFEKFNKSPGIHTFASVLIYGVTNPGRIQEFDMQAHELIDGSLLAINAVSQIMAHEPNIEASEELKEFLTADCYDKIKSLLTENPKMMAKRELLDTPKDDVLLAYIEEHGIRDGAKKAKIVTMSFPLFSWLRERWQENLTLKDEFAKKMQEDIMAGKFDRESMKESMQQEPEGYTQIAPYFDHNVIIVANWDLVQVRCKKTKLEF